MPFTDGLKLYHGSYVAVPNPDLARCERFKDFGQGFYLTTSYEQARSFVRLSIRKARDRGLVDGGARFGFVSRYILSGVNDQELSVLEFSGADSSWLRCVTSHRRRRAFPEEVKRLSSYDVIIGKIANDQTNITLALYMDGIYGPVGSPEAERACIAQLMPERLSDQYCLRSERALLCLGFEGSEQVWT